MNKMINYIKSLFSTGPRINEWLENGAVVLDVRTTEEFKRGHAAGSVNIPLQQLSKNMGKLKTKGKPIVACCASGMRSGQASNMLKRHGIQAMNGGAWTRVDKALRQKIVHN